MLNVGGELAFLLNDINYNSKLDLLEKLRNFREALKQYPEEQKEIIRPILSVAIQTAFYISEYDLLKYKEFCKRSSDYGC